MYPAYTGYNALSFQLVMRVHYSTNYENAFWDGSTMTFGDGASTFYPLVSADVAGHEVSHGFTEQHSNLTYSGQSGGMNEAFSDMGGEATEYYWKGTQRLPRRRGNLQGRAGALRYMCNPTQDGGSIDNAANYTSGMDVHYSSGVYNKAFCNLAKTAGWGTPTAFKVFARANALYWTASSTYRQRRLRRDDGGHRPGPQHGRRRRGVHLGWREHQQLRRRWRRQHRRSADQGRDGDRHRRQHRRYGQLHAGGSGGRDQPGVHASRAAPVIRTCT